MKQIRQIDLTGVPSGGKLILKFCCDLCTRSVLHFVIILVYLFNKRSGVLNKMIEYIFIASTGNKLSDGEHEWSFSLSVLHNS